MNKPNLDKQLRTIAEQPSANSPHWQAAYHDGALELAVPSSRLHLRITSDLDGNTLIADAWQLPAEETELLLDFGLLGDYSQEALTLAVLRAAQPPDLTGWPLHLATTLGVPLPELPERLHHFTSITTLLAAAGRIRHQWLLQPLCDRIPGLHIKNAQGVAPFTAAGTLNGEPFDFRYRHGTARLTLNPDSTLAIEASKAYGPKQYSSLQLTEFFTIFTELAERVQGGPAQSIPEPN